MSDWKTVDKWAFWGRHLKVMWHWKSSRSVWWFSLQETGSQYFYPCRGSFWALGRDNCICNEAGTVCFPLPRSAWVPCKEEKEVLLSSTLFLILSPAPFLLLRCTSVGKGDREFAVFSQVQSIKCSYLWISSLCVSENFGTFFWQEESKTLSRKCYSCSKMSYCPFSCSLLFCLCGLLSPLKKHLWSPCCASCPVEDMKEIQGSGSVHKDPRRSGWGENTNKHVYQMCYI